MHPQQLTLPMLTVYEGPKFVNQELVRACRTYAEAVRACWLMKTRRAMSQRLLAEEAGLYYSHVTDYVSGDENKRPLPAAAINAFEVACGNRFVTQWLNLQANVTLLEQFIESARRIA